MTITYKTYQIEVFSARYGGFLAVVSLGGVIQETCPRNSFDNAEDAGREWVDIVSFGTYTPPALIATASVLLTGGIITQVAHGFVVLDLIRYNSASESPADQWVKADKSTFLDATHCVRERTGDDSFVAVSAGSITSAGHALAHGQHFLSTTGGSTLGPPTDFDHVNQRVFVVHSDDAVLVNILQPGNI